ncbi:MAG: SusC/RagA family TonB-linked outer membrane protein, partial [Flavisolibacter sp.]
MIADGYYGMNPNGWSQAEADSLANVNADWANAMFRKNITKQHVLSLSGGNDRTRFFLSGSVFNQAGVVITTGLDRYTGRFNLDHSMGNFKLGLNGYVGSSNFENTFEQSVFIGSPLNAIRWHLPYVTPYLPDGSYNEADLSIQGQPNALEELIENPGVNKQVKGIASANLEYQAPFLPGLSARTNVGIDYTDDQNERYISRTTYLGTQQTGAQGSFNQSNARNTRYTITNSITYRKQADEHNFGINLFNEFIKRKFNSFGFTGFGLTGAFRNAAGIIPGTPSNGFIPTVAGTETTNTILSYFAIADYSFRNKYILNATVRTDGASKLAEGKKWTTFGGIGASWIVSAEDFMANSNVLNDLRLKVSYGSAANSNVGDDYEALEQFGPTSYNGTGGLILTNFRKQDLTWERRTTFNAGVDFGLWKNKLFGTVEFYNAITNDLYLNRQISGTNGATSILTNMGRLRNRGIEASLNAAIFKGAGFNWTISANHTFNQSTILELDGEDENINGLFINRVGERQNSLYVVRYIGVDSDNGEAIYLDKDGKETNVYDPNDRVLAGTVDPPHFGGVTNTFSYKGIELGVLFTYMFGHKIYNNDRTNVENNGYYYSSFAKSMQRAWMQQGDVTDIPGLLTDFHAETTRFVEDAKTFRLRNIILSYSLPANISGKIKASTIRLFVQGQNLLTWHDTQTYDPEVPGGNLLGSQYPALKTVTAGLTIGF